jgi:hypothetical protein
MKIYKRFFDARSESNHPMYAHIDGRACWLVDKPFPHVIQSTSFRAMLHNGPSKHLIRSFELGQAGQYYSSICRGIGENDLVNLFSSEQQAREHYEDAVNRHHSDTRHWRRV